LTEVRVLARPRPVCKNIWGEIGDCHVTAAARIVPHPFLGISVSDFRKFKCTHTKKFVSVWDTTHSVTPVAGRIFETKKRVIFLERFFVRGIFCPRTAFSGKKCRSILSNQVISWPKRVLFLETKEHHKKSVLRPASVCGKRNATRSNFSSEKSATGHEFIFWFVDEFNDDACSQSLLESMMSNA